MDGVTIEEEAPLHAYSTFRLGGPCRRLMHCEASAGLQVAVRALAAKPEPHVVMGGGSNLLISDQGFDGTVVRYCSETPRIDVNGCVVRVDGCTGLDELARCAAEHGLEGLNGCTGIPGTVGGAIAGNAGAWGKQIGDSLEQVTLMNPRGELRDARPASLGFGYRRSNIQRSADLVVAARFRLTQASAAELLQERAEILALRAEKHPNLQTHPCIGSIFRNIEPTSAAGRRQAAGWFLEQAGAKALRVGGARVFDKHANIVVKGPGCTAQDVRDLIDLMARAVRERFDFQLVREVRMLGRFRGEEHQPADRFY